MKRDLFIFISFKNLLTSKYFSNEQDLEIHNTCI